MSIAGIRSNRGDSYQILVALDWALTILSDPDFQWIEIDSVKYPVDDIVVGKTDGTLICCQCKKNQINFKSWTIADLTDELGKASRLLDSNKKAEVRFYSRSPFGSLAKLREHSTTQPDETRYRASLGKEQQKIDTELATQLVSQTSHLSTYDFLRRLSFETSPEIERMEDLLRERLRLMVSNTKAAYDALWTRLDQFGARIEGSSISVPARHRLTKDDLKAVLHQAGAILVPIMNLKEVRASFASTSAIGRSWRRDIAGQYIPMPVLNDLLSAIDAKKRAILLTGLPGSGKTCVMLALQKDLEQRAQTHTDILPLFIQAREFADLATAQDRQAQGLPEQWVEKAARMAEEVQVVVAIDSLDVLSIAREHSILTYFLAQIDRLLQIPNLTVVTACRDFDRHYDRRVAERKWDCELKCLPLDWATEIAPILEKLGIDTTNIDKDTHELIQNPRELALFVELALREGSFNVVNSQELALRYLDTIVRADNTLGETAMQAIETLANEMLQSRRLAAPRQRFTASQDVLRALLSFNVLQETHGGELMFGHQTLIDVLVINGAVRQGVTLNEFIQNLPPVPFVRPSIRSFVAYLKTGDRREFRKQVRAVLTGSAAFHIRRLVAESLAEQVPQADDWPMIRELRDKHPEVFQVIYTQAELIEWHNFWLKHLVPMLKDIRDADGLITHVHRISQWKNEDVVGVLAFWTETLQIDWIDVNSIAWQLPHYLSKIDKENLCQVASLLEQLLYMPRQENLFLGHAISRCVAAGYMGDFWLWHYIANDITDDDVTNYRLDDNKLHCQPHEFGDHNENFFLQRMVQSTSLLNLALESIEKWSRIKSSHYGNTHKGHRSNFLSATSYKDTHSQHDYRHKNSENILLDAMEAAILNHARINSDWWQDNRERLCFSSEGALRYFAIRACTYNPEPNIDLISRLLRDKDMLESDLSFELGTLMQAAFIYLDISTQDAVTENILKLWDEKLTAEQHYNWILKERAKLIVAIPRYLRSPTAKAVLEGYEKANGILIRQPDIRSCGGVVRAPFSYQVFQCIDDIGILRLMKHYSGFKRDFDEYLVGGVREIGIQLREASSRHPVRFIRFLYTNWAEIPEVFIDEILYGVANYLEYIYGNLRTNGNWKPLDEPDALILATYILDELERHPKHWYQNRAASKAVEACSHVIKDTQNASRLVFLAIGFAGLQEETVNEEDSVDLITKGINMIGGNIVEGLITLANNLHEHSVPYPELLAPTLKRFARSEHPAIRALIVHFLPYLLSRNLELGWDLFNIVMQKDTTGLWEIAERCLYYTYHNHFEKVAPLIERIQSEGEDKDIETWGRISALAALSGHIETSALLKDLEVMGDTDAWRGASSIWAYTENIKQYREQCLTGIKAGLKANGSHASVVAQNTAQLFHGDTFIAIPVELISLCITVFESDNGNKHDRLFGFDKWLNAISYIDPEYALDVAEIYLSYVKRNKLYLYEHEYNLAQLMTRLFTEGEEREGSDQGAMLRRVILLQDILLSQGVKGINDWLKAAERP